MLHRARPYVRRDRIEEDAFHVARGHADRQDSLGIVAVARLGELHLERPDGLELELGPGAIVVGLADAAHDQGRPLQIDVLKLQVRVGARKEGLEPFIQEHRAAAQAPLHPFGDAPHELALAARERECHQEPVRNIAFGAVHGVNIAPNHAGC